MANIIYINVPSGTAVPTGYTAETIVAPTEDGLYTLTETLDEDGCHASYDWHKQAEQLADGQMYSAAPNGFWHMNGRTGYTKLDLKGEIL